MTSRHATEADERDREAAREIQRQFALVKERRAYEAEVRAIAEADRVARIEARDVEKARVEALRESNVIPHEEE